MRASFYSVFIILTSVYKAEASFMDTIPEIVSLVQTNHISPVIPDDRLSGKIFSNFIHLLDPDKVFFYEKDLVDLEKYKHTLDNGLISGNSEFRVYSTDLLRSRIEEAIGMLENLPTEIIEKDLQNTFPSYPQSKLEKKQRLKTLITSHAIESYLEIHTGFDLALFSNEYKDLAEKAEQGLIRKWRAIERRSSDAWNSEYINVYLRLNDNQSAYLTTHEKQKWDEAYTRNFVGIGIEFEKQHEHLIIRQITPGGPASESNEIQIGDMILGIADSTRSYVETASLEIEEISALLMGNTGSSVYLKLHRPDLPIFEVHIKRRTIPMERLSLFTINKDDSNMPAAYIRLPRFYEGETRCSDDMASALQSVNDLSLDKLILDLRDNQGGSAREAIKIMGLFLEGGVVMQARYAGGTERIFSDPDSTASYTGDLVVLVNENSASACELFAGTMQDYKRAIVVGSTTFGKGTIQRFFEVNRDNNSIGEVKLTVGNFYTASGRSIQYKGITPDLIIPSTTDSIVTGERLYQSSLQTSDLPPIPLQCRFEYMTQSSTAYNQRIQKAFSDVIADSKQLKLCRTSNQKATNLQDYVKHCSECRKQSPSKATKTNSHYEIIADLKIHSVIANFDHKTTELEKDRWIMVCYDVLLL